MGLLGQRLNIINIKNYLRLIFAGIYNEFAYIFGDIFK